MRKNRVKISEGVNFHGHLGPYLILGILAGEVGLRKLKAGKHFGLDVKVWGAHKRPKSCLIDGLQLSTGATYGKGNIQKFGGSKVGVLISNLKNDKKIKICLKESLIKKLNGLKGHKDSEALARELYKTNPSSIFKLT